MTVTLTPQDHDAIKSALDGLDHEAHMAELKWGVGRLRLVVGDELRAKFDRQAAMLDKFLWDKQSSCQEIVGKIQAMRRAWAALDQAATQAGAVPALPTCVECPLPGGGVAAIAADDAAASQLAGQASGRYVVVYTAAEIGRMIQAAAEILTAKIEFPGAMVEAIRVKRPASVRLDDAIPGF